MSRSNPTETSNNPCTRWFEYASGADGGFVRYYDKEKKENVNVGDRFQFILLDELATVKGWHDHSDSGIYANEVRDTRQDVLVVKSFKGGELASGLYAGIRDRVQSFGGHFVGSCYIAYKNGDKLAIGNLAFKGAALGAWMEFKKGCGTKDGRRQFYVDAVGITGYTEGQKGRVVFRTPTFKLVPIGEESNAQAMALDATLQEYLAGYLRRPRIEASTPQESAPHEATLPARGVEARSVEPDPRDVDEFVDDEMDSLPF